MKILRKVCALLIVISLLMSTAAFAQTENQATEPLVDPQVISRLYALGIWHNQELTASVTRAEFAGVVIDLLGMGQVECTKGRQDFSDVPKDYPFYSQIEVLVGMGILNVSSSEGGTFNPDGAITCAEAVKMLVTALGYEPYASVKGGYPAGYMIVALENDIIPGRKIKPLNDGITYADVVLMLDKAIDAKILERKNYGDKEEYKSNKDTTVLTEYHHISTIKGILQAAGKVRINEGQELQEGKAEIEGQAFDIGITDPNVLLGYDVRAYYKEDDVDGNNTLIYLEENGSNNDVLKLEYENIQSCEQHQLYYWKNKEKDNTATGVSIPESIQVIKNDGAAAYSDQDFNNADQIILIDNNSDGDYDVARLAIADIFVVSSIGGKERTVFDKYSVDPVTNTVKSFELSPDDSNKEVNLEDTTGNPCDLVGIKLWSVLAVFHDDAYRKARVVVSNRNFTGVIEEISSDDVKERSITSEGKTYKIAKNLPDSTLSQLQPGDECNFYLDHKDRIAGFEIKNTNSQKYGFLVKAKVQSGVGDRAEFRMFINGIAFQDMVSAKKVEVDGTGGLEGREALEKLKETTASGITEGDVTYFRIPVRYKLNENGELTFLDTPFKGSNEDIGSITEFGNSTLTKYTPFSDPNNDIKKVGGTFLRNAMSFGNDLYPVGVTNKTAVYVVPTDASTDKWDDIKYYTRKDYTYFTDFTGYPKKSSDPNARLEAYDLAQDRTAGLLAYYTDVDAGQAIDETTPLTVVTKITQGIGEDGQAVTILNGYTNSSVIRIPFESGFNIIKYYKNPVGGQVASTIRRGDIIRYSTNSDGEINGYEKVFSLTDEDDPDIVRRYNEVDSTTAPETHASLIAVSTDRYSSNGHCTARVWWGNSGEDFSKNKYRAIFAVLQERAGNKMVMKIPDVDPSNAKIELNNVGNYNILTIDEEKDRIYVSTINELVAASDSEADASKIIVGTTEGKPRCVIIIKRKK